MADPTSFDMYQPTTWIPSLLAGLAGMYGVYRILKRDTRQDKQEQQVDNAVQQLITNLRTEVERLTGRVESMERELVALHEERATLLKKLAELEAAAHQPKLF